jgi:hypothetical protein
MAQDMSVEHGGGDWLSQYGKSLRKAIAQSGLSLVNAMAKSLEE